MPYSPKICIRLSSWFSMKCQFFLVSGNSHTFKGHCFLINCLVYFHNWAVKIFAIKLKKLKAFCVYKLKFDYHNNLTTRQDGDKCDSYPNYTVFLNKPYDTMQMVVLKTRQHLLRLVKLVKKNKNSTDFWIIKTPPTCVELDELN